MTVGLGHYLAVAAILFTLGILGIFINRKNVIVILMSIELILLAVNINLVAFSVYLHNVVGQIFAMFVLTLRHRVPVKRQDMGAQVRRTKEEAMEVVKVRSGAGLV